MNEFGSCEGSQPRSGWQKAEKRQNLNYSIPTHHPKEVQSVTFILNNQKMVEVRKWVVQSI